MNTYEIVYTFDGAAGRFFETIRASSKHAALAIFGTCPAQQIVAITAL